MISRAGSRPAGTRSLSGSGLSRRMRAGAFALAGLVALSRLALGAVESGDDLPAAGTIEKITWSTSQGATRLEFHGRGLVAPVVARASDAALRIDFTAASDEGIPGKIAVDTREIRALLRVPGDIGVLPEGVSVRWILTLARGDVAWRVDATRDRIVLLVADEGKVGRVEAPQQQAWAGSADATRSDAQPPDRAEILDRPLGIALPVATDLRAAPSALSSRIGIVPAGDKRLVDARRGDWVHVVSGGWLRLPQARLPEDSVRDSSAMGRLPAAWAVVTLGTGLDLRVEEVLPGDAEGASIEALHAVPFRLARFRVAVDPSTGYSFRLPSKRGRVLLELRDGSRAESLDPASLPLADAGSRSRHDLAFAAPDLPPGSDWRTWLVFPADLDFLQVIDARVDVDGRLHRLFRVPGSGEPGP